jgi:hypothetical protein
VSWLSQLLEDRLKADQADLERENADLKAMLHKLQYDLDLQQQRLGARLESQQVSPLPPSPPPSPSQALLP